MCKILFCLLSCVVLASDVISQKPPSITDITPNQTKVKNGPAEFACKVADTAGYDVLWKRTNDSSRFVPELISTNTFVNISDKRFSVNFNQSASSFNLKVEKIQPADVGTYICEIPIKDQSITQRTLLELEQPFFYGNSTPDDVVVNATEDVTIECYAGGSPMPNVTIRREDGLPIRDNLTSISENVLKIENITEKEEASYICTARSAKGEEERTIFVEVHSPPVIEICKLDVSYNPHFNAMVMCNIGSYFNPTVSWFKDGRELGNNETNFQPKFQDKGGWFIASLNITGEMPQYGFYAIKASNPVGSDESTVAFLTSISAPSCTTLSCPTVEESSCFVYILFMVIFLIIIVVLVVVGVVYIKKIKQKQEGNRPSAVTYRMPKNYE